MTAEEKNALLEKFLRGGGHTWREFQVKHPSVMGKEWFHRKRKELLVKIRPDLPNRSIPSQAKETILSFVRDGGTSYKEFEEKYPNTAKTGAFTYWRDKYLAKEPKARPKPNQIEKSYTSWIIEGVKHGYLDQVLQDLVK